MDAELLGLFDREVRGDVSSDGLSSEIDGPVTRVTYATTGFIAAPSDTGFRGTDLDALIARQRDHFAARGLPVEWKTYAYDEPADLTERLEAAGFGAEEPETVVVGSAEVLAAEPAGVDGVTIRETTDLADLAAIGRLQTEVWGEDWSWIVDDLADRVARLGTDNIRVLVARPEGEPYSELLSAAWLVMPTGRSFAGLWGGSTLAAWRGRGIYRALLARRAVIARDRGYRYLQVDASEMSRPILERLGFVALTTTTPYVYAPTPPPVG